jgi:Xaa-Pro aminopeptidase
MARIKTPVELIARIHALQGRLATSKSAAMLVTNPRDVRYLTGFVGDDSWALVFRTDPRVVVLSDFRFQEQIQREAPHVRAVMRKKGLVEEVEAIVRRRRVRRLALQPEHVNIGLRKRLAKAIGAQRLFEGDDSLIQQRAIKDRGEVKLILAALAIQQRAFVETLSQIKPGRTEAQIAAFLEYRMRSLGADGVSFPSIVAADANAALPHAIPGPRRLKKGGIVLIDWGARYRGYCSDMTRVVALGSMSATMREVYRVVLEAQLAAIEAIAPGRRLREVDDVARRVIRKAGYGKRFGHGLGHGIGLDIHEQPTLSSRAAEAAVLKPGHVVTVEPGIYLPGVGGVRIEDDVLVTERGHRVLSDLPKSLESAII